MGCRREGHWLMVGNNRSNPKYWMCRRTWCNPSIGPRISTCWWCVGHSRKIDWVSGKEVGGGG